jgi:hypothetical protein
MNSETLPFLEALFAPCEQGFFTFTAIHPDGRHPTPSRHVPISDLACLTRTLERLTAANRAGWGAYVGIATRKTDLGRWRRGGKKDLLALPALFADIDRPPELVLRQIQAFHPAPSCIIASGRGVHLYFFLNRCSTDFALMDRILQGLADVLHADRLTGAQSMRLVGSINVKLHRTPTRCELIQLHPDRRYTLEDFAPYAVLPGKAPARHRPRVCQTVSGLNPRVVEALADLFLAQGFKVHGSWLNGSCVYPERHQHGDAHPSFGYNTATGLGYCHVCGPLLTKELCRATSIDPAGLGGLMRTTQHV